MWLDPSLPSFGVEAETFVGEPVIIGSRSIYPLVRTSEVKGANDKLVVAWASPIALVIIENGEAYSIALTLERLNLEEMLALTPGLKEILDSKIKDNSGR